MALAASSVVSTVAVGAVVLGIAVLAVKNILKKRRMGGCGCGCSGCSGGCLDKNQVRENPGRDRR